MIAILQRTSIVIGDDDDDEDEYIYGRRLHRQADRQYSAVSRVFYTAVMYCEPTTVLR